MPVSVVANPADCPHSCVQVFFYWLKWNVTALCVLIHRSTSTSNGNPALRSHKREFNKQAVKTSADC